MDSAEFEPARLYRADCTLFQRSPEIGGSQRTTIPLTVQSEMAAAAAFSFVSVCALRRMQLRGRRGAGGMHDHRLHAAVESPLVRASRPLLSYKPVLTSRYWAGMPPCSGVQSGASRCPSGRCCGHCCGLGRRLLRMPRAPSFVHYWGHMQTHATHDMRTPDRSRVIYLPSLSDLDEAVMGYAVSELP